MDNYITIKKAVEITGFNKSTIYRKCNSKEFKKYVKIIGGKKYISKEGISQLENSENASNNNGSRCFNSHDKENENNRENTPANITLGMAVQGWSRADSKLLELQDKYLKLVKKNKELELENSKLRILENTDNKENVEDKFSDNSQEKNKKKSFWTKLFGK